MFFPMFSLILLYVLGVAIALQAWESYQTDREICHMRVNYGKCGIGVHAWYYNPVKRSCVRFVYALCGGNQNRFYSKDECEEVCLKKW